MLVLPDLEEELGILAFDPGTTTLGVSDMCGGVKGSPITVRDAFTFKTVTAHSSYMHIEDMHGDRVARLCQQRDFVTRLCHKRKPTAVIVESPYQRKFPTAFAALTECVYSIRLGVMAYDPNLPFFIIDPTSAKKDAGVVIHGRKSGKKTTKEDVREALRILTYLNWGVDIDSLDEHAIDATAVGHYFFSHYLGEVTL